MLGFGKPKSVVGLDIGSSAVKAVELRASGKGWRIAAIASEPVPPDSIVDGAIIDGLGPDGIAATTVGLAKRAGRLQTGYVYHYAFAMLIGVVILASFYLYRMGR